MQNNKLSIQQVKQDHQHAWLQLPGAQSVGLGLDKDGTEIIVIGVNCTPAAVHRHYPDEVEGYKVVLQTVGKPTIQC